MIIQTHLCIYVQFWYKLCHTWGGYCRRFSYKDKTNLLSKKCEPITIILVYFKTWKKVSDESYWTLTECYYAKARLFNGNATPILWVNYWQLIDRNGTTAPVEFVKETWDLFTHWCTLHLPAIVFSVLYYITPIYWPGSGFGKSAWFATSHSDRQQMTLHCHQISTDRHPIPNTRIMQTFIKARSWSRLPPMFNCLFLLLPRTPLYNFIRNHFKIVNNVPNRQTDRQTAKQALLKKFTWLSTTMHNCCLGVKSIGLYLICIDLLWANFHDQLFCFCKH